MFERYALEHKLGPKRSRTDKKLYHDNCFPQTLFVELQIKKKTKNTHNFNSF